MRMVRNNPIGADNETPLVAATNNHYPEHDQEDDTIEVVGVFPPKSNPTRGNRKITWAVDDVDAACRSPLEHWDCWNLSCPKQLNACISIGCYEEQGRTMGEWRECDLGIVADDSSNAEKGHLSRNTWKTFQTLNSCPTKYI
jgi:hypothetical protein